VKEKEWGAKKMSKEFAAEQWSKNRL